eukprot:COSAG01_NODE_66406_length_270_cov_0.608187_1_plen_53_part_01
MVSYELRSRAVAAAVLDLAPPTPHSSWGHCRYTALLRPCLQPSPPGARPLVAM